MTSKKTNGRLAFKIALIQGLLFQVKDSAWLEANHDKHSYDNKKKLAVVVRGKEIQSFVSLNS